MLYTTSTVSEFTSAMIASDRNCFASSKIEVILFDVPRNDTSSVFIKGFLGFSDKLCPKAAENKSTNIIILLNEVIKL